MSARQRLGGHLVKRRLITAFHNGKLSKSLQLLRLYNNPASVKTESRDTNGVLHITDVSLLHLAAKNDWSDVAEILIKDYKCDPEFPNNRGSTPLHYAARYGKLQTVKYLVGEHSCDPMRLTKNRWTAIHWAATNGHTNVVKYFVEELGCDPSKLDTNRHNPLHLACGSGHTELVQYLLTTGKIDPAFIDVWGCTPSEWARSSTKQELSAIQLSECYEISRLENPVDTYARVFLLGNKEAGKSSLARIITVRSQNANLVFTDTFGNIEGVELHTAGIIPSCIESHEVGNLILYDLAGQPEYYSSHAAVLENAMKTSAAVFILVIDISLSEDYIIEQIHYWAGFIQNVSYKPKRKSRLLIIGSHADLVSEDEQSRKQSIMEVALSLSYCKSIQSMGFLFMDCRKVNSIQMNDFIEKLLLTYLPILSTSSIGIDYTCHVLYAYLKKNVKCKYCTLNFLITQIQNSQHSFIPTDEVKLTNLLSLLADRGFIIFLCDRNDLGRSWVVIDIKSLIHEVYGTLFAPESFHRHHMLVSNIGIAPMSSLQTMFPQHTPEVLASVMSAYELCQIFSNSNPIQHDLSVTKNSHLFFSSLINNESPCHLPSTFQFIWCLVCSNPCTYFPVRFQQVLFIRLAKHYSLPTVKGMCKTHPELSRRCHVWRRGLYWINDDFVETVVEMKYNSNCLMVCMKWKQSKHKEMAEHRSSIISTIMAIKDEFCSYLEVNEGVLTPQYIQPRFKLSDYKFYAMEDITRAVIVKKGVVDSEGQECMECNDLLPAEPYCCLTTELLIILFKTDEYLSLTIPEHIIQTLTSQFYFASPVKYGLTYSDLKKIANRFSIFGKRNIFVSLNLCYSCRKQLWLL